LGLRQHLVHQLDARRVEHQRLPSCKDRWPETARSFVRTARSSFARDRTSSVVNGIGLIAQLLRPMAATVVSTASKGVVMPQDRLDGEFGPFTTSLSAQAHSLSPPCFAPRQTTELCCQIIDRFNAYTECNQGT
jgi:hypothetical protein